MNKCDECFFNVYKEEGKVINSNPCVDKNTKCENFINVDYLSGEYSDSLIREFEMMEHCSEQPEHF